MTTPKTQCPECEVWHDDHKNKWCDACVYLFGSIHGFDKMSLTAMNVCKTCELNERRPNSAYCQDCSDDFNNNK